MTGTGHEQNFSSIRANAALVILTLIITDVGASLLKRRAERSA